MIHSSPTYKKAIEAIAAPLPADSARFLVTGASGLIGSCIVDALLCANERFGRHYEVCALGRSMEKLTKRFGSVPGLTFLAQNITEPIQADGADYIIHAASNADPRSYALYPAETIMTNVSGTRNVLEFARQHGAKVLFTSTFEVYGKLDKDRYTETDYGVVDLDLIRSCYPESKRVAESLVKAYADEYGVCAVTARLASIYGPTMQADDSKAHAQFIKNALAGQNIVLKSKGEQRRTYCYVMDTVSAIFHILFNGKPGEAYNVANENSIVTIAELAGIIADVAGTKVVFDLPDAVESKGFSKPQNCILATEKLQALGWSGKYDAAAGVNETMQILRETALL